MAGGGGWAPVNDPPEDDDVVRLKISSLTSRAQSAEAAAAAALLPDEDGLLKFGLNMCRTLRQGVGATTGAATLRLRVLKAEPCHDPGGGGGGGCGCGGPVVVGVM